VHAPAVHAPVVHTPAVHAPVVNTEAATFSTATTELECTMAWLETLTSSQNEKLFDDDDFFNDIVDPETTSCGTNTYVSLSNSLDVVYHINQTIRAPKQKLDGSEVEKINSKITQTDITLPCDGQVTFELRMK
jgi:hypothetical protein